VLGPGTVGAAKQIVMSARSSYLRPHAFSADGTKIAFESDRSGAYGIWTANVDGSDPTLLYGRKELISGSPAWSSDGRFVAFDTRSGKHTQIFVIAANGGPVRELTSDQFDSMLPSWSRMANGFTSIPIVTVAGSRYSSVRRRVVGRCS